LLACLLARSLACLTAFLIARLRAVLVDPILPVWHVLDTYLTDDSQILDRYLTHTCGDSALSLSNGACESWAIAGSTWGSELRAALRGRAAAGQARESGATKGKLHAGQPGQEQIRADAQRAD